MIFEPELLIDIIVIGKNHRELPDMTDVIEREGLREPISVLDDGRLFNGRRRLEAIKNLGKKRIPANIYKFEELSQEQQLEFGFAFGVESLKTEMSKERK